MAMVVLAAASRIPAGVLQGGMTLALILTDRLPDGWGSVQAGKLYQRMGTVWGAYLEFVSRTVCSRVGHVPVADEEGSVYCSRCGCPHG